MRPQRICLLLGQPKHKILRKARKVACYLLVEPFRWNAIELRKAGIQHHFLSTDEVNLVLNPFAGNKRGECFNHAFIILTNPSASMHIPAGSSLKTKTPRVAGREIRTVIGKREDVAMRFVLEHSFVSS